MVLITIGFIISALKYSRNAEDDTTFFAMIGFGVSSLLSIVIAIGEFKSVLMCWTAPNIRLIERGLSLLK